MHLNWDSVRAILLITTIITDVVAAEIRSISFKNRRRHQAQNCRGESDFLQQNFLSDKERPTEALWVCGSDFLTLTKTLTVSGRTQRRLQRDTSKSKKQFTIKDITVPPDFLRVEYMIGYTFLGTMYGLGFLVLFQSLLVPLSKGLVALLYMWLLWLDVIEPVTLQEALQQIPPSK